MSKLTEWLPITVWAAITVFIARELLEGLRRRLSSSRKGAAYKAALARDCELNLWTLKSFEHAIDEAEEALSHAPPQTFTIETKPGSYEHWRRSDGSKRLLAGGGFPPVKRSMVESCMIAIAELGANLFVALQKGVEALAELDHLRGSLLNFARTEDSFETLL